MIPRRGAQRIAAALTFACLGALTPAPAHALEITLVQHEPAAFDPGKKESVRVRFRLSAPARVTLRLFDGRDLMIRSIASPAELPAGDAMLVWDGRDEAGRPVPPEAYTYTLEAVAANGTHIEYDVTDYTGGEDLEPVALAYDAKAGLVTYTLPQTARVNVRVALKNGGPLLGTVVDWVARPAGPSREVWSGEAFGAGDLSLHPNLELVVQAFSLPRNTLLVLPAAPRVELIEKAPWPTLHRAVKRKAAKRMFAHSQQPIEARGDFKITLALPPGLARNPDGLPVLSGTVPVRLDVANDDRARALASRFESVFYLDGQYAFENEMGYLPATVNWDLGAVNPGPHHLTANIRGYEGNFGAATLKVFVVGAGDIEDTGGQSLALPPATPPQSGKAP